MGRHNLKLVISPEEISERVNALANKISEDYSGKEELIVIGILKGAFIFTADLVRAIKIPTKIDFIRVASYGYGSESSGKILLTKDIELPIAGKDVLLVEDIVDTGLSLAWVIKHIESLKPASLKVCVFIDKMERKACEVKIDYRGFAIEKGFLVGYGLDYSEQYRYLKGIYEVLL